MWNHLLIHHIQIVIIVISHRIAWCFGGGQGVWLGFAFVPTFELIGFAVACFVGIWQGFGTGVREVIARNACLLTLSETSWRCDFGTCGIDEVFGDFF